MNDEGSRLLELIERTEPGSYEAVSELTDSQRLAMAAALREKIIQSWINRPLAIEPTRLNHLMHGGPEAFLAFFDYSRYRATIDENGVGVIPVDGPLMQHGYYFGTSYKWIERQYDRFLHDDKVKGIILDIDSPGGEVSGMFDVSDHLHAARGRKPTVAVANDFAASAAYAIASSVERVVASRTSAIGSVGVIARHLDRSEEERMRGLKFTEIAAGAKKSHLSPHRPLDPEAIVDIKGEVDRVYGLFTDMVARNRSMDAKDVRATEAAVYYGTNAVQVGFVDELGTIDSVRSHLGKGGTGFVPAAVTRGRAEMSDQGAQAGASGGGAAAAGTAGTSAAGTPPVIQPGAQVIDFETIRAEERAKVQKEMREAAQKEVKERAEEINELCALAGFPQKAGEFIASDKDVKAIRAELTEMRAKSSAGAVDGTHGGDGSGGEAVYKPPVINRDAIYARRRSACTNPLSGAARAASAAGE